jgi:hypothetical protein
LRVAEIAHHQLNATKANDRKCKDAHEPAHLQMELSGRHRNGQAFGNPRTLAINLPCSSLERDFCRQRLARQKGPEGNVSAQRPEIGDHHTREMAAKTAFSLANYQLRVSEDRVVAD